jgi:hypothetical protein
MPYVTCSHCALTAYTAARWTTTDDCPGCGAPLASARRSPASGGGVPSAAAPGGTTTLPAGTLGAALTVSSGPQAGR